MDNKISKKDNFAINYTIGCSVVVLCLIPEHARNVIVSIIAICWSYSFIVDINLPLNKKINKVEEDKTNKRYFLITVGIGDRDIEVPFSTKDGHFINRGEMLKHLSKNPLCLGRVPIIKMIFEFKSESDFNDFND